MQKQNNQKHVALLLGLLMSAVWCGATEFSMMDGFSNIVIKEGNVQSSPKGSTIQASIDGHVLSIAFTENLGQVAVEINTATGMPVDSSATLTPNGIQFYIPLAA